MLNPINYSNVTYYKWSHSFDSDVIKPLNLKFTALRMRELSYSSVNPEKKIRYNKIFWNFWFQFDASIKLEDIGIIIIYPDNMPKSDVFRLAYTRTRTLWTNGITFIMWLHKFYANYNMSFTELEFKFIDYWIQSSFILDQVVNLFQFKAFAFHVPDKVVCDITIAIILYVIFIDKPVFDVLYLWWCSKDIEALVSDFPFDIFSLSKEAQLFFYFHQKLSQLSMDSLAILSSNSFKYVFFDMAEANIIENYLPLQMEKISNWEQEILKINKNYVTINSVEHFFPKFQTYIFNLDIG